mgnify:CR=1 FL=1
MNGDSMFAHDMPEYSVVGYRERTLGGVKFEVRFTTALEATVQALEVTGHGTEDVNVVQKYFHERRDEFIKYFHDGVLESSRCLLQAEHHDKRDIDTLVSDEGRFIPTRPAVERQAQPTWPRNALPC